MNASPEVKDALYKLHQRTRALEEAELHVKSVCVLLAERLEKLDKGLLDFSNDLLTLTQLVRALNQRVPDQPPTG